MSERLANERGAPWTVQVPRHIYRNKALKYAARIVGIDYANEAKKTSKKRADTVQEIAKRCNLKERTIRAARTELVAAKVIDRGGRYIEPKGPPSYVLSDWTLLGADLTPYDRLFLVELDAVRGLARENALRDQLVHERWRWEVVFAGAEHFSKVLGAGEDLTYAAIDRLHERGALTKIPRNGSALLVPHHQLLTSSLSMHTAIERCIAGESARVAEAIAAIEALGVRLEPSATGRGVTASGSDAERAEAAAYAQERGITWTVVRLALEGRPVLSEAEAERIVRERHAAQLDDLRTEAHELAARWLAERQLKPAPAQRQNIPPPTGPKAPKRQIGRPVARGERVPDASSSRESHESLTRPSGNAVCNGPVTPLPEPSRDVASGINPGADHANTGRFLKSALATTVRSQPEFPLDFGRKWNGYPGPPQRHQSGCKAARIPERSGINPGADAASIPDDLDCSLDALDVDVDRARDARPHHLTSREGTAPTRAAPSGLKPLAKVQAVEAAHYPSWIVTAGSDRSPARGRPGTGFKPVPNDGDR